MVISKEKFDMLGLSIAEVDEKDRHSALIPILYKAQDIFGYIPKEAVFFIGEKLDIPSATIYGVVSFYSYFTTKPKGRHQVKICKGTACFVCGAEDIAHEFEQQLGLKIGNTTDDLEFSLESVRCVGACGLAPAVLVGENVYAKVQAKDVKKILKEIRTR